MSQAIQPAGAGGRTSSTWSSSVPTELRPLGGSRLTFRGRTENGAEVAVKAVAVSSRQDAERMLEYLRRLAGYGNPTLVPILGAEYRDGVLLVMSELDDGLPLSRLMARSQLSPSQVIAVGLDVLGGLQALQQLGLSHGNLHAGNVHVSRLGRARLGDYGLRPRFRTDSARLGWPDPRVDLVAAGTLLADALGSGPRQPSSDLSPAERSVPAVVAAVRVMAEGGAGRFAGAALGLFEEASGSRSRAPQLDRSRRELASLVRGEQPARLGAGAPGAPGELPLQPPPSATAAPVLPAAMSRPAAAPGPAPPSRPAVPADGRYRNVRWLFLAAALSLLAITLGLLAAWVFVRPSTPQSVPASAQAHRSPAASAGSQAAPSAAPSAAPTSQPDQQAAAPAPTPAEPAAPPPTEPAAQPAPPAEAPPAAPAAAGAGSPTGAVSQFYDRVVSHDFGGAVGLWSPGMQSAYPPADNINSRFANTTSMSLRRNEVVSSGGGRAVVAIDLVEVRGGQTYHWVGNWYLVQSESGWLLDRPGLRPA